MRALLALLALAVVALVFSGCGSAGSGGSPQADGGEGRRAPQPAGSKSAEGSGDGRASKTKLGHPALGSAEAPVVLTEYSDYQ